MNDERLKYGSVLLLLSRIKERGSMRDSDIRSETAKSARDICLDDPPLIERIPYVGTGANPDPAYRLTRRGQRVLAERRLSGGQAAPEAAKPAVKPASKATGKASLDARALALYLEDPSRTKTGIAKLLGLTSTQSLAPARCPRLAQAMQMHRTADPKRRVRGSKGKDGTLEAWEDEEGEKE